MVSVLNRVAEEPAEYSSGRGKLSLPESALARLWQQRATRREEFRTAQGRRVRVLYPGRPGRTAGPDFRDAVLEFDDLGVVRGDVEIHLRQGDWNAHGHQKDPNYNGVVLHASLELSQTAASTSGGGVPPAVSLQPLLDEGVLAQGSIVSSLWDLLEPLGYPQPGSAAEMVALLERAGDARFRAKSRRFQKFIQEQDPEQTLYEAVLESLGYRQNQRPFLMLARCAPYPVVVRVTNGLPSEERVAALESWLLELAGFVTEGAYRPVRRPGSGWSRPMSGREWHCFRVRPANHPRRRIAGAARLLARFMDRGLLDGLREEVWSGPKKLIQALTVGDRGTTHIGTSRAAEIAVNVVLPFFHGLAAVQGRDQDGIAYLEHYASFGKLPDNEITREMAGQLFEPSWGKVVSAARHHQGLIHLQRLLSGAAS